MKVINLFGAPGRGKSATRGGLFWLMKAHHQSVEEVTEYAKYLVLMGNPWQLQEEQLYLFSKQHHQQLLVERNGFDYALTDSPLYLCSFYAGFNPQHGYAAMEPLVDEAYARHENLNFFLTRDISQDGQFEARGRAHGQAETVAIEHRLREYLAKKGVQFTDIAVDALAPWRILEHISPGLASWPEFSRRPALTVPD